MNYYLSGSIWNVEWQYFTSVTESALVYYLIATNITSRPMFADYKPRTTLGTKHYTTESDARIVVSANEISN